MNSTLKNISDLDLIRIIESFPILYDKDLARGSQNAKKKDDAWREVSLHLNASERACITRWKSIRDRFGKEYRRILENPDDPVTWDVFPDLMFLKNHYKHGFAKNDTLPDLKYEPKVRKRRTPRSPNPDEDSQNDEEVDCEDVFVNQQLIELVKERPVLYDRFKIRDSKNLTAKNDAWQEISESIGISEVTCYKRWKKLRDGFSREYRRHQINPEQPVVWEYFKDLMFLEGHYRKGIPLNVDGLKKPTARSEKIISEESKAEIDIKPWGDDFPFDCIDSEQVIPEENQDFIDIQKIVYEELPAECDVKTAKAVHVYNQSTNETTTTEPETQLISLVSNISEVLQQSQDCLQAFRKQNEQQKKQMENMATVGISNQPMIFQKMNVLLEGMSTENQKKAERKIVQFLCECQIKTLNNEDIDDIGDIHIC